MLTIVSVLTGLIVAWLIVRALGWAVVAEAADEQEGRWQP